MENHEDQIQETVQTEVQNTPVGNAAAPPRKCSGDLRVFVIALLTSVIVVLAYHGIVSGIRCLKRACRKEAAAELCQAKMQACPIMCRGKICDGEKKHFRKDGEQRKFPKRHHRQHQYRERQAKPNPTPEQAE